jgi:hypothetical protein
MVVAKVSGVLPVRRKLSTPPARRYRPVLGRVLVVGARRGWRGRRTMRRRGGILLVHPLVTEQDRAMFAVARAHPAAKGDQVLVRVDHGALRGPRRARVVPASIEGDPSPAELVTSADLWPGQSTAHAPLPRIHQPRGLGPGGVPHRVTLCDTGIPCSVPTDNRTTRGGQEPVWSCDDRERVRSASDTQKERAASSLEVAMLNRPP